MAGINNQKALASLVVHVGLDSIQLTKGLDAMKSNVRAATNEWKSQFSIFNQLGDHVGAAKAKYDGLTKSITAQQKVVESQRSQLSAMGARTQENAAQYDKLATQINKNVLNLSKLTDQQDKAKKAYDYELTGIRNNKSELSLLERQMASTVQMYQAQGNAQAATAAKTSGLRDQISKLTEIQGKEQSVLEKIKNESGADSEAYREQSIRLNELATRIARANSELSDTENSAKKPLLSISNLREGISKAGDQAHKTSSLFKAMVGASLVSNAIQSGWTLITTKMHEASQAGAEYNKQQQVMNATWNTLTASAAKGNKMVNSINSMSVAFGQNVDLVNELDQQFYHVFDNQPRTEKLTKSVLTLADTLGMSGDDVKRLGLNFTHMLSSGRMQLGDFNMITDQLPMYGEKLLDYERKVQHNSNLTMATLRKEMSAGKISAQDAEAVMEELGMKYSAASENMMKTLPGMERIVSSRMPALVGAFEKPFQSAQSSLFSGISKWVSSNNTSKLFTQMGQAASKGMTTILNAFGKVFGNGSVTDTANNAVKGLTRGIQSMSNFIAAHAKDIVGFFKSAKTFIADFAKSAGSDLKSMAPAAMQTFKTVSAVAKPFINLIADHPKLFADLAASMIITNKASQVFNPQIKALTGSFKYLSTEGTLGNKAITSLGGKLKSLNGNALKGISSSLHGVGSAAQSAGSLIGNMSKATLDYGKTAAFWVAEKARILAVAAAQKVAAAATKIWSGVQAAFNVVMNLNPIGLVVTAVAALTAGVILAYKHFKPFRDFINGIGSGIKDVFGGMGKWLSGVWHGITSGVGDFVGGIGSKISGMAKSAGSRIHSMASTVGNGFGNMKKWAVKANDAMASQISDKNSWLNKHTNGAASTMFTGLKKTYKSGYNTMHAATNTFGDLMHGRWSKLGGDISKTSKSAMNTAKNYFQTGYNTLNKLTGGRLGDLLSTMRSWGNKVASFFRSLPGRMASGIRNGAKALGNAGIYIGNKLIDGVQSVINGVVGGINWVLGKVSMPKIKKVSLPNIPYFATGTVDNMGRFLKDMLVHVGDGNKPELIKRASGKMELSPSKDTLAMMHKGDAILGGDKTAQLLQLLGTLPKFASGSWLGNVGSFFQGAWDKVSQTADNVWNYMTHPTQLLKSIIGKFTDSALGNLGGTVAEVGKGIVKTLVNDAGKWLGKVGGSSANPPGSGVQRWKPDVIRALQMNGLSTSTDMVNKVLRQIATESGGNPNAVQHGYTDINTLTGNLARGLMQVIPPTFAANKFPGHSNIMNGFDNLLAALKYAKNRYGKSLSYLGQGHGYKNGGIVTNEQVATVAEGNLPEAIIPLTDKNRAIQLMYQALDYFKSGSDGGSGTASQGGNSDLKAVIDRQDAQLTLMQKQINLLTKLLFKEVSIDPADFESGVSKKQAKRLNNQAYMLGNPVTS